MMTTLPRTLCCHLPNKAAVEVQEKEQRAIVSQLEYFQRSPTGPTVLGDTQTPARQNMFRNAESNFHPGDAGGTSPTTTKSDPSSNK